MKIKVCGLTDPDNIKAVAALSPDYMGFICYDRSPRYISQLLPFVLKALPLDVHKTAVFVNEDKETIDALINKFGFNAIQLHGAESPEFCLSFRNQVQVIKAFGVDDNFDFAILNNYAAAVDYFLFDTKTPAHGGSGKIFNWDILQNYKLNIPFFLSGGLGLHNLAEVEKIQHPRFYGADLNSRFETRPGIKDIELLEKAFKLLRQPVTR